MADANAQPVFQIQRIYLKDLSLEQPNSPQIDLAAKRERLLEALRALRSAAVAFSGGIDSTVVAKAAHLALGDRAVEWAIVPEQDRSVLVVYHHQL